MAGAFLTVPAYVRSLRRTASEKLALHATLTVRPESRTYRFDYSYPTALFEGH